MLYTLKAAEDCFIAFFFLPVYLPVQSFPCQRFGKHIMYWFLILHHVFFCWNTPKRTMAQLPVCCTVIFDNI